MNRRILLVATEGDVLKSIPITLKLAGHTVSVANCGLEGIKQARCELPDLVVVDATLPDMEGETLIDILRRLPSTATLRTMLFTPRPARPSLDQEPEHAPTDPANLLAQVAFVLTLCQDAPALEMDPEYRGM